MSIGWIATKNKRYLKKNNVITWSFMLLLLFVLLTEAYICKALYMPYLILCDNPRFEAFISIVPIVYLLLSALPATKVSLSECVCTYLRKMSILIYLSHQIIMMLIWKVIGLCIGLEFYLVTVMVSVVLSICVIEFSKKFQYLKYLY